MLSEKDDVQIPEGPSDPEASDKDKKPAAEKDDGNIWLILFLISLALNIIGIVVVIVFTILKNKKLGDDVPLVNYNIEDDAN